MTIAAALWIVGMQGLVWLSSRERPLLEACLSTAGLLLAVATHDLLWALVGLEVFFRAGARRRALDVAASVGSTAGLLTVAIAGGGTDLARVSDGSLEVAGLALILVSVAARWGLATTDDDGWCAAGPGVAWLVLAYNVSIWSPDAFARLAPAFGWLVSGAAVVAGACAARASRRLAFLGWVTVSQVALGAAVLGAGAPAAPSLLAHVAVSTLAIALLRAGPHAVGAWLALLTLASVPPLPGFVTKLALLTHLEPVPLVLGALSLAFVGAASLRHVDAPGTEPRRAVVTGFVVATSLALAAYPEPLFWVARRLASGL